MKIEIFSVLALIHAIAAFSGAVGTLNLIEKSKEGLCDPDVRQQFGYFDLETGDKHYFFWYFESRNSPSTDPLVLWLNGGPGCSSELGLFTENGPCTINKDGEGTKLNKHSWNNNANLIFVDQPAGTGFSYGADFDSDEEEVGKDFLNFLKLFFEKNQQLRNLDFYVTGESYGGHYVPAIAHAVWESNKQSETKINLKGIGIGNGLVNAAIQYPFYPEMAVSTNHHAPAVSKFTYFLMKAAVKPCVALIEGCERGLPGSCVAAVETCNLSQMGPYSASGLNPYDMRLKCEKPPLCNDYSHVTKYLNSPKVRETLGIPANKHWETCNTAVNLEFNLNGDGLRQVSSLVSAILDDIKVVVYAGDQDYICNWLGNKAWVDAISTEIREEEMTGWMIDGKEVGTHKKAGNLQFIRIYEAGHMVPQDQPEVASRLLSDLLLGHENVALAKSSLRVTNE